jgi:hypothetical protein
MPYQYVTVKMPWVQLGANKEAAWTDRLNAVAAEGWRLVSINEEVIKNGVTAYATFEREVQQ